jgi:RNA polymerase sigma-70 factor (ECF subfamily)
MSAALIVKEPISTGVIGDGPVGGASSDTVLILACQKGDGKAFDLLMRRHKRSLYAMLNRLAPDWSGMHDDMVQEAMIRIYRGIKSLRNPGAFRGWMNQTVTNLFYDELRKKPKFAVTSIDAPIQNSDGNETSGMDIADFNNQPDELLERKEIMAEVNTAIAQLPDSFRRVIVLRAFHGRAYDEIARLTKSEVGTVKSRLCRARIKVQACLNTQRCA